MSDKLQYDASLGGTEELDSKVNLLHYASARAKEIQAMKASLLESTSTKLAFQRLPKHMRRRVMSHNVKRLPRRLREIHLKQLQKSGLTIQLKKNTRRYKRRPSNLLNEFARRQRTNTWLETHIWHAKRFHMINKWGYKLPGGPCDKAFRACYRACTKHCLVQDMSYFSCVEISGQLITLVNYLGRLCDPTTGLTFGAKAFIRGNREGQAMLFNIDTAIQKPVGTVYFNWKPVNQAETTSRRTLWIWIHPAYYSEALDSLIKGFGLSIFDDGTEEIYSNKQLQVSLKEMEGKLNRFRLTGPLSTAILRDTLETLPIADVNCDWFKNYLSEGINADIYIKQCEYWKNIQNLSPSGLSPHLILSLTVIDPRYRLPKTRKKAILEPNEIKYIELPENLACGPLWNVDIRNHVKEKKTSNAKFAEMRSQLLVPGSDLKVEDMVPVMLIQRIENRNNRSGFGSGWDLIVPSGWGHTFWMALIMRGGRAGGLREFNSVRFENGCASFLEPDTQAGMRDEEEIKEMCENRFFSLPPDKRPNYTKFGTLEPFHMKWKDLVNEWSESPEIWEDFFVFRDREKLTELKKLLTTENLEDVETTIDFNKNYIVPIWIKLLGKGLIKRFARIYLPEPDDLSDANVMTEPLHPDPEQSARKEMRFSHKETIKKLKRKIKTATGTVQQSLKERRNWLIEKHREEIKGLWLPKQNQTLREVGRREMIGFVTAGDFSFTQARSCAIGYITLGAMQPLIINSIENKVLVRNISASQYTLAEFQIIF